MTLFRGGNSSNISNGIQQAPKPLGLVANNRSFRFNTNKIQTRHALKRHFDRPLSSIVQSDAVVIQRNENLEIEMTQIVNHTNNNVVSMMSPFKSFQEIDIVENKFSEDNIQQTLSAKKYKRSNCKYKVMFKTQRNGETTIIDNSIDETKKNTKKRIYRCPLMNDLRNVGATSSLSDNNTGPKNNVSNISTNSVIECRSIPNQCTSSNSCSFGVKEI